MSDIIYEMVLQAEKVISELMISFDWGLLFWTLRKNLQSLLRIHRGMKIWIFEYEFKNPVFEKIKFRFAYSFSNEKCIFSKSAELILVKFSSVHKIFPLYIHSLTLSQLTY